MRNHDLPRLSTAVRWAALLTASETACVLEDHRRSGVCFLEATLHYTGGTGATTPIIRDAIRLRREALGRQG